MWNYVGKLRSAIYDKAIVSFTSQWYAAVLEALPAGSRLLDVGIGTGAALVANADTIRRKKITVVGVDYDAAYIERCNELLRAHDLSTHVSTVCCSFYEYTPKDENNDDGGGGGDSSSLLLFDHVYFSGSFMILPDSIQALRKATDLLRNRETGRLYFTQTFELQKNALLEWLKPTMTYWTTIDFGNVTYVEEFDAALRKGGTVCIQSEPIQDGKTRVGVRESRLVVARSANN